MTLIYLTLAWLVGIAAAHALWQSRSITCYAPTPAQWGSALVVALAGAILLRRRPRLQLAALLVLFALGGAWRYQSHPLQPCFTTNDLAAYNGRPDAAVWVTVEGIVVDDPDVRDEYSGLCVAAESVTIQEKRSTVHGLVYVRAPRFGAPGVGPFLYGDRVRASGLLETPPRLEGFDYRAYLARQDIHSIIYRPRVQLVARGQGSFFWQTLYAVRQRARQIIERLAPEPAGGLLSGILLGIGSGIPRSLYDAFNATATSHIIVISGSNISVVAGLLMASLGRLLGARRAAPLTVLGIVLYVLFVGADAAVVRAGIMGSLAVIALQLGRPSTALVSLAASALLMTAINPLNLWDMGFQLSAMATLGLIVCAPPLQAVSERWLRQTLGNRWAAQVGGFLNDGLLITLAAQITTTPLVVYAFGRLSLISLATNFLILPVQPFIMLWGGAAVLVGFVPGLRWLAQLIAYVPWLCLSYTVWVVQLTARLPSATLDFGRFSVGWLWAYYALLGLALAAHARQISVRALWARLAPHLPSQALAGGLATIALLLWLAAFQGPDGLLHVYFLDVGQGDAILIRSPGGRQVLVDGGPSPTQLAWQVGRRLPFWDRSLDVVILSHPDGDHINGLIPLVERYDVSLVIDSPLSAQAREGGPWLAALQRHGVRREVGQRGQRIHLGDGVWLDLLHPPDPPLQGTSADENNNSVVVRLGYGRICLLLTGDVETAGEEILLQEGASLRCPVLKVSHHGSAGATSEAFLAAAAPQVAIIQVGAENRFGHPAAALLDRLAATRVYRTDQNGTIEVISDGERLWISTER